MASPPDENLVISAALAEYTALRSEVTNRIGGQDTMLNLYMTAVAAIFGFALSGHADLLILLVVPLLSTAVPQPQPVHQAGFGLPQRPAQAATAEIGFRVETSQHSLSSAAMRADLQGGTGRSSRPPLPT
jgi:hypothetical protein